MKGLPAFLLLTIFVTGCYTNVLAPGATGRVVDATTGTPIRGARITRSAIPQPNINDTNRSLSSVFIPPEGLPAATIASDLYGKFDLPPEMNTQIAFMYLKNADALSGSFLISADGYATNIVNGLASPETRWRVKLGRIALTKTKP